MRTIAGAIVMACGLTLAGCSTRPLQEDATRIPTTEIVRGVRCETRLAIANKAADLLEHEGSSRSFTLARIVRATPHRLPRSIFSRLSYDERLFYLRYINYGIGYVFSFDISETNNFGLAADPLRALSRGTAGVTFGASNELTRQNVRRFSMLETFGELLFDDRLKCDRYWPTPDPSYPISGSIGMDEVIDTFINLNEGRSLEPSDKETQVFADTLKFTTARSISATPHIILTAIDNKIGLTGTNVALSAGRTDIHQLIIGMSKPPPPAKKTTSRKGPARLLAPFAQPALPSSAAGQSAKERALDAATQQPLLNFYDRFGTLPLR